MNSYDVRMVPDTLISAFSASARRSLPLPRIKSANPIESNQTTGQPVMHETCCPQYTIRLDVARFKPVKAQRQVLNRLRRYLDGEDRSKPGGVAEGGKGIGKPKRRLLNAGDDKNDARSRGVPSSSASSLHARELQVLSTRVAAATRAAMAAGELPAECDRDLQTGLAAWSQVMLAAASMHTWP